MVRKEIASFQFEKCHNPEKRQKFSDFSQQGNARSSQPACKPRRNAILDFFIQALLCKKVYH